MIANTRETVCFFARSGISLRLAPVIATYEPSDTMLNQSKVQRYARIF